MKSPRYVVTTILVCCFVLSVLTAKPPEYRPRSCCVKYSRRPLDIHKIKGVTIQEARWPCRLRAVIFHTINMDVCANLEDAWVKRILEILSKQFKALSKTLKNYKILDKMQPAHITVTVMPTNSTSTRLIDADDY